MVLGNSHSLSAIFPAPPSPTCLFGKEQLRTGFWESKCFGPEAPRKVARECWTLLDVLAHGVVDYHPTIVGPPSEMADHMQEWFEAGAADGFWINPDVYEDGLPVIVDEVVPILQERGLFYRDYAGRTLREHLGARPQYGIDPRLM